MKKETLRDTYLKSKKEGYEITVQKNKYKAKGWHSFKIRAQNKG